MRLTIEALFAAIIFMILLVGCSSQKIENPVLAYKAGMLPTCGSKDFLRPESADVIALLEGNDVRLVHQWAVEYFKRPIPFPAGGIIFIHALPNPNYAPEADFIYVFLEKDTETGYCDNGGTRGEIFFNNRLLEKYSAENP